MPTFSTRSCLLLAALSAVLCSSSGSASAQTPPPAGGFHGGAGRGGWGHDRGDGAGVDLGVLFPNLVWGDSYAVDPDYLAPGPAYAAPADGIDHSYCRTYSMPAQLAGQRQMVTGTACRQPDGSWQIVR